MILTDKEPEKTDETTAAEQSAEKADACGEKAAAAGAGGQAAGESAGANGDGIAGKSDGESGGSGENDGGDGDLQPQPDSWEAKAKENYDLYLRAVADLENLRKRTEKQIADAHQYVLSNFAHAVGDVRDCLQQALAAGGGEDAKALREGVELTFRKLITAMEAHHILPINPDVGAQFDPNLHAAIGTQPASEKVLPGMVAQVVQVGYMLNGRVIRPANVFVAAAAKAEAQTDSQSAQKTDDKESVKNEQPVGENPAGDN